MLCTCCLLCTYASACVSLQSEYVARLVAGPPEEGSVTAASARAARDGLMTLLLVSCVGRPSHVTGLEVAQLKAARVSHCPFIGACLLIYVHVITYVHMCIYWMYNHVRNKRNM